MMSNQDDDNNSVGLFLKAMVSREPGKRKVKPSKSALIDLAELDLGESSDDSDFHVDQSKLDEDDDISLNSGSDDNRDSDGASESDDDDDDDRPDSANGVTKRSTTEDLLRKAEERRIMDSLTNCEKPKVLVCAVCLGDYSDDNNEIVICDGCHVSVHEGCYGISDTISVSSTVSSSSTEPWFCDSCKSGVQNPTCELCPNLGHGIFKETETGCWVHLVCALYIPGIAFTEVDKLASPTLFEMSYSRYGAKSCNLCEDQRFSRTGVCIGCDAGMCRSYFHVTCAQREGLLSEVNHGEADQADPYYAHCRLHTDKELIRKRKRNWLALQMVQKYEKQKATDQTKANDRLQFKLQKYKEKYAFNKSERGKPWLPTQKMPRSAATSASLFRSLLRKTKLMGLDTECESAFQPQMSDIRKKWHLTPAFSCEYISYVLDRNVRFQEMKIQLQDQLQDNEKLVKEEAEIMARYSELTDTNKQLDNETKELLSKSLELHDMLKGLACRPLCLPGVVAALHDPYVNGHASMPTENSRPTAGKKIRTKAATKMMSGNIDVSFDNKKCTKAVTDEPITLHQCDVCQSTKDQHLLIQCDMCRSFYHLSCLDPPLNRMPKKTKQMGWQCSDCCKSSDSDRATEVDTAAPRKLRRNIKEPTKFSPSVLIDQKANKLVDLPDQPDEESVPTLMGSSCVKSPVKASKKRGRKKIRKPRPSPIALPTIPSKESPKKEQLSPKKEAISPRKETTRGRPRKKSTEAPPTPKSKITRSPTKQIKEQKIEPVLSVKPLEKLTDKPSLKRKKSLESFEPNKKRGDSPPVTDKNPIASTETSKKIEEVESKSPAQPSDEIKTDTAEQDLTCKEAIETDSSHVDSSEKEPVIPSVESTKASTPSLINTTEFSADSLSSAQSECLASDDALPHKKDKKHRENKKKKRDRDKDDEFVKKKKKHHHKERPHLAEMSSEIVSPFRLKIKPLPPRPLGNTGTTPHGRGPEYSSSHTTSTTTAPPGYPPLPPGYTLTQPMQLSPSEVSARNEKSSFQLPYITVATGSNVTAAVISNDKKTGVTNKKKCDSGSEQFSKCDVCGEMGGITNTVTCDECLKAYHFNCLEPPLKKSPKRRGYSWFCEDCGNGSKQPETKP